MLIDRKRASEEMERLGLDALIATTLEHVLYASRFESLGHSLIPRTQVFAIVPKDESSPVAVAAPVGELDRAAELSELSQVKFHPYGVFFYIVEEDAHIDAEGIRLKSLVQETRCTGSAGEALRQALGAADVPLGGVIGVDEQGLSASEFAEISQILSESQVEQGFDVFRCIRRVKGPDEIRRLRRAVEIAEKAVQLTLREVREKITERELAEIYECEIIRHGARPTLTVIGIGSHSAFPNGRPCDRVLREGDIIRFDVGCSYLGYHADIARTAVLGDPSPRQMEVYAPLLAGHLAGLERIRSGTKAHEVFETVVSTVRANGLPNYDRHHVGHCIGLELYEPPILNKQEGRTLEAGMVVNVEPPYYEIGLGGFQVEDTVCVTEDGFECFNQMSKGLIAVRSS